MKRIPLAASCNEGFVAAWFVLTLLVAGCDSPCEEIADHYEKCQRVTGMFFANPDEEAFELHQLRTRECEGQYLECQECRLDRLNDDCSNFHMVCGPDCYGEID